MISEISIKDVEKNLAKIISRVEFGESFVVTDMDKAIAKIVPISERDNVVKEISEIREISDENRLDSELKELKNYGRK